MNNIYKVGVLGATGTVGQRILSMLDGHPWFKVTAIAASDKSAGKPYSQATAWQIDAPMPSWLPSMIVQSSKPGFECDFVLSALDADVATEIEGAFAAAGVPVISNAKNFRMDADVPLVIPEVNGEHLALIEGQRKSRGWGKGFIATNPNCSTVGLVVALKPLLDAFGLKKVAVTTMQAISGAGYPGVPSLDILDNIIPYIGGEEEKMEKETLKILGADFPISAQCNRVHVRDGHLECVSVELGRQASAEEIIRAWREFVPATRALGLPSCPDPTIVYHDEPNRPQPRRDRDLGKGMAVSVGRLRPCKIFGWKFVVLSHNTIRGAAGAAITNAELMAAKGIL